MERNTLPKAKRLFGLFAIVLTTTLHAQSLNQDDLLPEVGARWHMGALQTVPDLITVERPIVWDFSGLFGNDVFGATFTMLAAENVPASADHPGTDRVLRKVPDNGAGTEYAFYDVHNDKTTELAHEASPVSTLYEPGALVAAYPLAYNATTNGVHCSTVISPGSLSPFCGTTEIRFLNTGLLRLNYGDFPDARLVRTRRSSVNQLDPTDSTMLETLTWYTEGISLPLLQFHLLNQADGTQSRSGLILDEAALVGIAEVRNRERLHVFPVPSADEVRIQTPVAGVLRILASDGREVYSERIPAAATPVRLKLGHLPAGTYHAVLQNEAIIHRGTLVLAR